jgi:hypothetical protein
LDHSLWYKRNGSDVLSVVPSLTTANEEALAMAEPNTITDFWSRVRRTDLLGCWIWTAKTNGKGYGLFNCNGTRWRAHRFSYALAFPAWRRDGCVLHRCDNTLCVNPAHLFLGSQADNIADMVAKGRDYRGNHAGELNSSAKLTAAQVIAIYSERSSLREAAKKYGVSQTQISKIRLGKIWKSVPRPPAEVPLEPEAKDRRGQVTDLRQPFE